ncbi:alpha/beta fold hydrolase [Marivirga sp. S37H4]|uniref:Alpha/beta fold hydrolase n=1 Tax=Marivirga aurantiaca TaxID=2802615 RepID=A0A935CCS5_9BACT|nr:alpha/beta fold hydrolase [Marivirga aurantiaca]MBK6266263.1 alpha/beta fold hydrolase [Marivirga aurantiaca]
MPLIINKTYKSPFYAFNQHIETIIPSAIRKVKGVNYHRERITTPDNDFLDIDWLKADNDQLVIISHGLEGSSHRPYVKGIAKLFHQNGWDALAWNCRSCSEEMNKNEILYHHGFTEDVDTVVQRALADNYKSICLIGFSMGGSLTLKYLGENADNLPDSIKAGMAVSVPCDLEGSSKMLALKENKFYQSRFMRKLSKKMLWKNEQFPGFVEMKPWKLFKNFHEFDTHYSAKIFGFKDAADFYQNVQCLPFIENIKVPTLVLNALNDPMLADSCYPKELAERMPNLTLEISDKGGHVGFMQAGKEFTYAEERALQYFSSMV